MQLLEALGAASPDIQQLLRKLAMHVQETERAKQEAQLDTFHEWVEEAVLQDRSNATKALQRLISKLAAALPNETAKSIVDQVQQESDDALELSSLIEAHVASDAAAQELAAEIDSIAEDRIANGQSGYGALRIAASVLRAIQQQRKTVDTLCAMVVGIRNSQVADLPSRADQFRASLVSALVIQQEPMLLEPYLPKFEIKVPQSSPEVEGHKP